VPPRSSPSVRSCSPCHSSLDQHSAPTSNSIPQPPRYQGGSRPWCRHTTSPGYLRLQRPPTVRCRPNCRPTSPHSGRHGRPCTPSGSPSRLHFHEGFCPDTEEVTGSNPVSPTKKALVSHPFATLRARLALGSVDLSAKLCRPIAGVTVGARRWRAPAPRLMTGRERSIRLHTREKREKLPAISVSCSSVGTCPGQPKVLQGRESQSSRR
jgi:hypothetical protein